MKAMVRRRLASMLLAFLGVAVVTFVVIRILPGDIAMLVLGGDVGTIDPEILAATRERLGVADSIPSQFFRWISGIVTLDFGESFYTREPVIESIARTLPYTAEIALLATLMAVGISIPLGTLAAVRQNSWLDHIVRSGTLVGLALPSFWLGIMMLLLLVRWFNWSPPLTDYGLFSNPWGNLQLVFLPALAVSLRLTAVNTRLTRSSMIDVLHEEYVVAARSRGIPRSSVIGIHALRNAVVPVFTLSTLEFGYLFGGLIVTENVFQVPGLGSLLVQSVTRRDFPIIQATILAITLIVMIVNLLTDLGNAVLDPRIRSGVSRS